jgi:6-phosphogluconolactonase
MVHQLNKKIIVFNTYEQVSIAVAHYILNASVNTNHKFSIALSGGSTPELLYHLLAGEPFVNNINWKNILIFLADERYVPHSHADSNFKMITDTLLSKIKIPRQNIFPINTTHTAAIDALAYEQKIKSILKNKGVDLMLLGIGNDGHTASLFPGYTLSDETKRLVKEEFIKEKNQYRISCTLPFINKSKQILFLVSGKDKAVIFKKIMVKQNKKIPATLVQPKTPVLWFVDKEVSGSRLASKHTA